MTMMNEATGGGRLQHPERQPLVSVVSKRVVELTTCILVLQVSPTSSKMYVTDPRSTNIADPTLVLPFATWRAVLDSHAT